MAHSGPRSTAARLVMAMAGISTGNVQARALPLPSLPMIKGIIFRRGSGRIKPGEATRETRMFVAARREDEQKRSAQRCLNEETDA